MCGPDQPGAAPAHPAGAPLMSAVPPASTGLASTGLASTGLASTGLASTAQALAWLHTALAYLAAADAAALTATEQAQCLLGLERAESVRIAARSSVLTAFGANCGFAGDGHGSERSWLRWQARITSPAAGAAVAWARRLTAHPAVRDALAAGAVSASWAREMCDWSDQLPEHARSDADQIMLAAAAAGAGLADLAGLAQEIRNRTAQPDRDSGDDGFADRSLRLDLHYRGAGHLRGDLTPRCANALQAVLDALGTKAGPEDTRNRQQRDHDALEEACRRLVAAGCVPGRAGQPTQIQLHMTLDQLLGLPTRGGSGQRAPSQAVPGGWAGPGPVAAPGDWCDASIVPVVAGHADHDLLDRIATGHASHDLPHQIATGHEPCDPALAASSAAYRRELLLRDAVALLSGPAGLASRLRATRLRGPAASISLPLDIGAATDTIPPHLRRAVILRDVHCGFPGCLERNCQVHHIVPLSEGGATRLDNLVLGCSFHHLIVIHQWGWQLLLNADGTKTAISPDGSRVLHTHSPPDAA